MKNRFYWLAAFLVTLLFALFQRLTGPTYPVRGGDPFAGGAITSFRLPRSCVTGAGDCLVKVESAAPLQGAVLWKREGSAGAPGRLEMVYDEGRLNAILPDQPPAGRLEYSVAVRRGEQTVRLGGEKVMVRFRGAVASAILIPHVLLMFLFMLFSVRIAISLFTRDLALPRAVAWNTVFLVLGGFVFGPLTQYQAFGHYWSGWPFGGDMTDNKTLVLLLFWLAALRAAFRRRDPRSWLAAAFAVTLLVYFIPHSAYGSRLDHSTGRVVTGRPASGP